MSDAARPMDVDAFLSWAEGREGKWELHEGEAVAMAPEMAVHARVKAFAAAALIAARRRHGGECGVYADGLAVRVARDRAFIPDVLMTCPPLPERAMETTTPLIVVEVLSPSTAAFDHGPKLEGYFSLASLAHCLLIDPERRVVIHHSRGSEGVIETRILRGGEIRLDPPGLVFPFAELYGD